MVVPAATAWLVIGYFGVALLVDLTFTGATFCKFVCPMGQFNFVASTLSPLEMGVRELAVCRECRTVDCIKGRGTEPAAYTSRSAGASLALFLPMKAGNLDCTFCLDCVQACPHDNVAHRCRACLAPSWRTTAAARGIGRLSQRADLAALAMVFTFAALLNAFAMIGPVYATSRGSPARSARPAKRQCWGSCS